MINSNRHLADILTPEALGILSDDMEKTRVAQKSLYDLLKENEAKAGSTVTEPQVSQPSASLPGQAPPSPEPQGPLGRWWNGVVQRTPGLGVYQLAPEGEKLSYLLNPRRTLARLQGSGGGNSLS